MQAIRILLSSAAATLAMCGALGAATPDPYRIFAQARQVWISQNYPQYLSYTIVVTVDERGVEKTNHYRATYDALHDRVYVDGVSEEERLDPHVPTGINKALEPKRQFLTLFKKRVGNTEEAVDFLGVPMLAPNYSFGVAPYVPEFASPQTDQAALVASIRRDFNDPISAEKATVLSRSGGLAEIGHVVSTDRAYDITYDEITDIDGRDAYHLSLRPVHPSGRLRLREIWIDAQTYAIRKLATQGNFADGTVPWTAGFASVGGTTYVVSESAEKPVSVGGHTYDRATIEFQDIVPAEKPRYLWNPVISTKNVLVEPSQ